MQTDKRKAETEVEEVEDIEVDEDFLEFDDAFESPTNSIYTTTTADLIPPETPMTKPAADKGDKGNTTPLKLVLKTKPKTTPVTPKSVKKNDSAVADLSARMSKASLSVGDKILTTSTYVSGIDGLLVVPMIL